jgi:adenosylcobinamide-GDP ribazoletransferase
VRLCIQCGGASAGRRIWCGGESVRRPGWQIALSLFTVIPVGGDGELGPGDGVRAVRWLPAVGLLLGLAGACLVLGVGAVNGSGPGRALGAALAVALVAFLTGGLHLDGLADTADGLGSRRSPAEALDIMRRSDIGPMGVATLVLVLLVQVTALAAIPRLALAAAALALAEVTGRVAIVVATEAPAARPGGFGTLVAGQTTALDRALSVGALACAVAAAGLLAGALLQSVARRRLGGTTGDVFGAIAELSIAAVLVAAALLS